MKQYSDLSFKDNDCYGTIELKIENKTPIAIPVNINPPTLAIHLGEREWCYRVFSLTPEEFSNKINNPLFLGEIFFKHPDIKVIIIFYGQEAELQKRIGFFYQDKNSFVGNKI